MKWRKRAGRLSKVRVEQFTMLPTKLLTSKDWTRLPPAARVIFVDMCKRHHHGGQRGPSNNGEIGYGCAAGAKAANVSPSTAWRMLLSLRASGLIRLHKGGTFKVEAEVGQASEWEIAIYPMRGRRPASWGDQQLHLRHWMLNSAVYSGLSNQAKCILCELMRRFDGGNNGHIVFGGPEGASAGLSDDVTERALTELKHECFIMMAAPAIPYQSWSRQWRLTMYPADGKAATKDFMRVPKRVHATPDDHFIGADDPLENVSTCGYQLIRDRPSPVRMPKKKRAAAMTQKT